MDPDIKAPFQVLIESQARTDKSIAELTTLLARHVEVTDTRFAGHDERFARLEELHARTEQAIADMAVSADARMLRIEENLDGLIRAIAREHSNGKGHD